MIVRRFRDAAACACRLSLCNFRLDPSLNSEAVLPAPRPPRPSSPLLLLLALPLLGSLRASGVGFAVAWPLCVTDRCDHLVPARGGRQKAALQAWVRLNGKKRKNRLNTLQQLQGWRAVDFQTWALALAPRTFFLKVSNSYRDEERFLFKMRLSP